MSSIEESKSLAMEASPVIEPEKGKDAADVARIESAFVNLSKFQAARIFWRPTLLCVAAMVAVLMDGYAVQTPGNIIANPGFIEQFGTVTNAAGHKALDPRYVSIWGGVIAVTVLIGQQVGSIIADRFGRVPGRIFLTLVLISAAFGEMFSVDWRGWLASKAILGLGQGLVQGTTLSYVAEIAPTQIRGSMVAIYGIFIALGQLCSAIALQIVSSTDPYNWKKGIYSQWALQGIWICCLPFLPESPWWHARGHRHEKAKRVLTSLNRGIGGYDVDREYAAMEVEIAHEEQRRKDSQASSYREIFTFPNFRRTIAGAFGVSIIQLSGAGVVFSWTTFFFQQAGISQPFQATVIVYTLLVSGAIVSVLFLTERFGRRAMILTGGSLCCVCNFLIAGLGTRKTTNATNNAILAFICIWVASYALCLAGVAWGLSTELASPRLRAKTTAFSQNFYQCFAIIFGFTIPLMLASGPGAANWGVKTLFLYGFLGGFCTLANYFTLPEVRGRTYNEIDEMFAARVPPRKMEAHRTLVEQEGTKIHR